MRPYEYYRQNWEKHMNERISATKQTMGLLCSFQEPNFRKRCGSIKYNIRSLLAGSDYYHTMGFPVDIWRYSFRELKQSMERLKDDIGWDLILVGKKQNSIEWMDEVLRVIMASDLVIVDVTQPRSNVIYELGIACALRAKYNVVITQHVASVLEASEPMQLQIMKYNSYKDLQEKLKQYIEQFGESLDLEIGVHLDALQSKISPNAMHLLSIILINHIKRFEKGEGNVWNLAVKPKEPAYDIFIHYVIELKSLSLVEFNYGYSEQNKQPEWSVYPTEQGIKYLSSLHFLKKVFSANEINEIELKLKEIEESGN